MADFFNYRNELNRLTTGILGGQRMIVVEGLRRTGKSSLIRTALNTDSFKSIYIDLRRLILKGSAPTTVDFTQLIIDDVNSFLIKNKSLSKRAIEILKGINGIQLSPSPPYSISLSWEKANHGSPHDIGAIFSALGESNPEKKLVLAFDEAQILARVSEFNFQDLFGYIYDAAPPNVVLVFSGSEVGLLYEFLGLGSSGSSLNNKPFVVVKLEPLQMQRRNEFLATGLVQVGKSLEDKDINLISETLGGIMGWLTFAGNQIDTTGKVDLDQIVSVAAKQAAQELDNFMAVLTQSQARICFYALSRMCGPKGDSTSLRAERIRELVQNDLGGANVSEDDMVGVLNKLGQMSFIVKDDGDGFLIPDPMHRHAVESGFVKRR